MSRFTFFIGCLIFATTSFSQGIDWDKGNWNDLLNTAKSEDKMIFVDMYTTWCRPCIQMDMTVFPDTMVGKYFNEHFISVKLDAEDAAIGTQIARTYEVGAYPSLLFVNGNGELMSSFIGMHSKYELVKAAMQTTDLFNEYDFVTTAKANINGAYSHAELKKILEVTEIHDFLGKEQLAMRYLDQTGELTESDLRLVMSEVDQMEIKHLKRLAPLTTQLSYDEMYLRKNGKEWISWKTNTEKALYDRLKKYQKERSFNDFEAILDILKYSKEISLKAIDNLYLDYYKQNDLEQYKTFATYVISEYVIPSRPEDVKKADEEKYHLLHNEVMKDMNASKGRNPDMVVINNETSNTPLIDSIEQIYTISRSIADQLYDISSDFYVFYEDSPAHRKAKFWSSLAIKYYPYDRKYYDNYLYILESSGETQEASSVRTAMQQLPWYHEMLAKKSF